MYNEGYSRVSRTLCVLFGKSVSLISDGRPILLTKVLYGIHISPRELRGNYRSYVTAFSSTYFPINKQLNK